MKPKKPILIRFRQGKLHRFHCKNCRTTYIFNDLLLCPKCNGEMGIIIRTPKGPKLIPLIYPTVTPPEAATLRKIIRP